MFSVTLYRQATVVPLQIPLKHLEYPSKDSSFPGFNGSAELRLTGLLDGS